MVGNFMWYQCLVFSTIVITDMSEYTIPKIWGPHFWFVIRAVAYNYPDNPSETDKNHARTFYTNMKHVLPCENCSQSYAGHLEQFPLEKALANRLSLRAWVETIYRETEKQIRKNNVGPAPTKRLIPSTSMTKTYYPPLKRKPRSSVTASAREVDKKVFKITKRCNCGQ